MAYTVCRATSIVKIGQSIVELLHFVCVWGRLS